MNYGEIIEKGWKILWRFKILWIFGLFSSCAGSTANTGNNFRYNFPSTTAGNQFGSLPPALSGPLNAIVQFTNSIPTWGWILIFVFFAAIWLLFLVLGAFGQIGMIRGAWLAEEGATHLEFGDLFHQSAGYFWRAVGVNLLLGLPGIIFGILGAAGAIIAIFSAFGRNSNSGIGIIILCLMIPFCCVMVPVFILLGLVNQLASVAVIGEGLGVMAAIQRGWKLFRTNLWQVLLAALLLFGIGLVAGWVIGIPGALFAIPIFGGAVGGSGTLVGLGMAGLVFIYLPLSLAFNSVLQVFLQSAWTVAFRQLARPVPPPASPFMQDQTLPGVDFPTPPPPVI